MIVERQNNEILVRIPVPSDEAKLKPILDYLNYLELTSKSTANDKDPENLIKEAKKGRWNKIKKKSRL